MVKEDETRIGLIWKNNLNLSFFFFTKQNRKGKSVINFPLRARIEEYIRRYFQPKTNVKDLVKLV